MKHFQRNGERIMLFDYYSPEPQPMRKILIQIGCHEENITPPPELKDIFLSFQEYKESSYYKDYPMSKNKLNRLGDQGILRTNKKNRFKYYNIFDIAKFHLEEQAMKEELGKRLLSLDDGLRFLGYQSKSRISHNYYKNIFELEQLRCFEVVIIEENLDKYPGLLFITDTLKTFKKNYIPILKASEQAGIHLSNLLIGFEGQVYKLIAKNNDFHYLKKDELDRYLSLRQIKEQYYHTSRAAKELQLGITVFKKVVQEYNVQPIVYGNGIYYKPSDIVKLKEEQERLFDKLTKDYITRNEALDILDLSKTINLYSYRDSIEKIEVPNLIRINKNGINLTFSNVGLYNKKDVLSYGKKKIVKDTRNAILNSDDSPFRRYQRLLTFENIEFPPHLKETKKYLLSYIRKKLKEKQRTVNSIKEVISLYFSITDFLINIGINKEIFQYNEHELNLAVFNNQVESTYRLEIYKFLKDVEKIRLKNVQSVDYKFSRLKNPHKYITDPKEKEIYSIDDYIMILDYVGNINLHISKSIEDAKKAIKGKSYKRYASTWLYVLLHLNNAWRHHDVATFPRIDISELNISGLEWFEQNKITFETAEYIVNRIKAKTFIHSKTGKKRNFICSRELTVPLAHAVIISELIQQSLSPNKEELINYDSENKTMTLGYHKCFFKELEIKEFRFESLKMNRTLISYMYNVIKKLTNRNPLEITKFIRSHTDEETTNIYIFVPQEHIDFLTQQLFEIGHFGYAYDLLGQLVLGKAPEDRLERTERMLEVKEVFGDVIKIEQISGYLNALTRDKTKVKEILLSYSPVKLNEINTLVKLGQNIAKEEGYQCVFRECAFEEKICSKCPAAITNLYALSQIGVSAKKKVIEFQTKFSQARTEGEKTRLSNLLYADLYQIQLAVKRYGEETVSTFIEGGIQQLRKEVKSLPSMQSYVTIKLNR